MDHTQELTKALAELKRITGITMEVNADTPGDRLAKPGMLWEPGIFFLCTIPGSSAFRRRDGGNWRWDRRRREYSP